MGSIPLPALGIKPPEDPLTQYAKIQSIRGQRLQQQEQQTQLDQQNMDMASQKAMMKAYQDANGDLTKATELAAKYGAKPDAVIKLKQASIEQQKSNLELLNAKGARAIQEADMMQGAHDQVAAAPPEQRPAVYQQTLAQMQKAGLDISQVPPQYPGDEAFNFMGIGLKGHKQQLEELAKQTEIGKNQAQTAEANASLPGKQAQAAQQVRANAASVLAGAKDQADYEARRGQLPFAVAKQFPDQFDKDAVLQSGMTPHEQASIPVDKIEMKDWLHKNPTKTPSDFIVWKAHNSPTMMMNNQLQLSPEAIKMAGELYKQTGQLPGGLTRAPQVTTNVINSAAKTADGSTPNIAENKIDFNTKKALDIEFFGRGQSSRNIRSLNTAIGHLGQLADAADALQNGDIKALNKVANFFKVQTGSSAPSVFDAIKTAATGELGSTFKGSAATDPEIAQLAATLNKDLSGNVNKAVIATDAKLLGSRLYALQEQYAQNSGKAAPRGKILYGHSEATLNRLGVKPEESSQSPQGGGTTQQPAGGGNDPFAEFGGKKH